MTPSLLHFQAYLDPIARRFEQTEFIADDPISFPHAFDDPRDQEIIGLFAALLAWGRLATMLAKLEDLIGRMAHQPASFVRDFRVDKEGVKLQGFVHRTINADDMIGLCLALQSVLRDHGTLEQYFAQGYRTQNTLEAGLEHFSSNLLARVPGQPKRMNRVLSRPSTGSACKRLVMYLRWMVRPGPVDLGIWTCLDPSQLALPLDVHSGRQARAIGMLHRKSNDWRAVEELTAACRLLCPDDPAKYDFAFFGTGSSGETLQLPTLRSFKGSVPIPAGSSTEYDEIRKLVFQSMSNRR